MSENRQDLIPRVMIERDRQMRMYPDNKPDVLILHPIDAQELFHETHHTYLWANSPDAADVVYGTFYGMDIMETPLMTAGYFVVGRRKPIQVIAVEGRPKSPVLGPNFNKP